MVIKNLKCLSIFIIIFILLVVCKHFISYSKSYTNRSKVTSFIKQRCAKFKRKHLKNNTSELMRNATSVRKNFNKMTRIGFFLIGRYQKLIYFLINLSKIIVPIL